MVDVGQLAIRLDYREFDRGTDRMVRSLKRLQDEARRTQGAMGFAPGRGRGGLGPGRGVPGGGGGGGGLGPGTGAALGSAVGLRGLGAVGVGLAGVAGLRQVIRTTADLELQLAQVGAVTGATAEEMAQLERVARDAGAATQFSAGEAAAGLLELSRAGLDVGAATKALRPSLDLATAGLIGLGESADLVTNVASQFQLPADEIQRIGDVLVGTANRSNTTVAQLGQAMKDVGVVSSSLGISLEDTSAALGVLANFGLRGSDASIKLRQAFLQLLDPSAGARAELERIGLSLEDIDIRAQGLPRVLANLQAAGVGRDIGSASRLVGSRNAAALTGLASEADGGLTELRDALAEVEGESRNVAATIENTTSGKLKQLSSAFDELALSFEDATGFVASFTRSIEGLTSIFRSIASGDTAAVPDRIPRQSADGNPLPREQRALINLLEGIDRIESSRPALPTGAGPLTPAQLQTARARDFDGSFAAQEEREREIARRQRESRTPAQRAAAARDVQRLNAEMGAADSLRNLGNLESQFGLSGSPSSGIGGTQQLADRQRAFEGVTRALREEAEATGMSAMKQQEYFAVLQAKVPLQSAQADSIRSLVREIQNADRVGFVLDGVADTAAQIGAAFLTAADDAEEFARRAVEALSQLAVQELFVAPIRDGLSDALRGSFGGTGSTGREGGGATE